MAWRATVDGVEIRIPKGTWDDTRGACPLLGGMGDPPDNWLAICNIGSEVPPFDDALRCPCDVVKAGVLVRWCEEEEEAKP